MAAYVVEMCTYYVDMDGWVDGRIWQSLGVGLVLFCYDGDDDDDGVMGNVWF